MAADLRARLAHVVRLMALHGPSLGPPHTLAFGDGLFEIRLKGKETIARIFFCYRKDQIVVLLHSFIKKTQKTPSRELERARKRMQEVKDADA